MPVVVGTVVGWLGFGEGLKSLLSSNGAFGLGVGFPEGDAMGGDSMESLGRGSGARECALNGGGRRVCVEEGGGARRKRGKSFS